jgi:putative Holliday junction resolvase
MGRILAIDYGKKRSGIAVTDPLKLIASALATVPTGELLSWLTSYMKTEPVERFVIGDPKNQDGTPTDATRMVHRFIGRLENTFPQIPVTRVDERFTSKMASRSMVESGMKKKDRRNKALVDQVSATLILQGFLQTV